MQIYWSRPDLKARSWLPVAVIPSGSGDMSPAQFISFLGWRLGYRVGVEMSDPDTGTRSVIAETPRMGAAMSGT